MRYAIFSDIHANRQALAAVLRDMRSCGAEVLVCLGDVIGYGPCPQIVLDAVRKNTPNFVLGNHDAAACGRLDSNLFNDHAREVIEWTRAEMNEESLKFLNDVPMTMESEDILFVHAEVEMPGRFDYIEDVAMASQQLLATDKRVVFVGHTHFPTVFAAGADGKVKQLPDQDQQLRADHRYIVNVGSVGEPRDGSEIRARYAIYDSEKKNLFFRRVEFDIAAYRKDLTTVGLKIEPFFLTVDDGSAKGEAPVEIKRDMKTVVNVSPAAFNAKPKKLILPGGIDGAAAPSSPMKMKVAAESEEPKAKVMQTVAPVEGAAPSKQIKVAAAPKLAVGDAKSPAAAASKATTAAEAAEAQTTALAEAETQRRAAGKKKRLGVHIALWLVVLIAAGFAGMKLWKVYGPVGRPLGTSGIPCGKRLVSYWTLDNTLGTSGGVNRAKGGSIGHAGFGHNGQFGLCLRLDGSFETFFGKVGDYGLGADSMTASIWYRFDSLAARAEGFLLCTGDNEGWRFMNSGDALLVKIMQGGQTQEVKSSPVPNIKDGRWHHAVIVFDRDSGKVKFYADGKPVGDGELAMKGNLDTDNELTIGGGGDDSVNDFPGALDDVAIWGRALAGDEISDLFKFGKKGESLGGLLER
ncbi:MAG: putative phosphodiesterase [Verrucomicrobiales bacterium]|jgi:predicted phosphodiesterase